MDKFRHKKKQFRQLEEDLEVCVCVCVCVWCVCIHVCMCISNVVHIAYDMYCVCVCVCEQTMQKRLSAIKSEKAVLEATMEQKQTLIAAMRKELNDLEAKKDRLSKQV